MRITRVLFAKESLGNNPLKINRLLTCNGRRVPLRFTGTQGEYVAGVRYRAWQPPSALHPTIGVHTPLTFDIFDTWNGRNIGGCRYHVMHAGGRNSPVYPVNSAEAEARRVTRFQTGGHTPPAAPGVVAQHPSTSQDGFTLHPGGPGHPPAAESPTSTFPYTLDLRTPLGFG